MTINSNGEKIKENVSEWMVEFTEIVFVISLNMMQLWIML